MIGDKTESTSTQGLRQASKQEVSDAHTRAQHTMQMQLQMPQVDYALVRQDMKIKAGMLLTYLAVVRALPFLVDGVSAVMSK